MLVLIRFVVLSLILNLFCVSRTFAGDTLQVNENAYVPTLDAPIYKAEQHPQVEGPTFTMHQLAKMPVVEAMAHIRQMQSAYNISDLFAMNGGTTEFYLKDSLMNALREELRQAGTNYTLSSDCGIAKYAEIMRAGMFRAYYNQKTLGPIFTWEYKEQMLPALHTIIANPNFGFGTNAQDAVVKAVGSLMSTGIVSEELLDSSAELVNAFAAKHVAYEKDSLKVDALMRLGDGIDYALAFHQLQSREQYLNPSTSQFYGKVDTYVKALSDYLLSDTTVHVGNSLMKVHAVRWMTHYTGRLSKAYAVSDLTQRVLKSYTYVSKPWIEAVRNADYYYSDLLDGKDMKQIRKDVENALLPCWYYFEDSTLVFQTGADVSPQKVKALYWATKEVRDQFMRLVQLDTPIDGYGRPDDHLLANIYNSPEEYEYNWFVNEVSTDNGGMYIEGWGRFFTYERTEDESIYTLEDLFRHEFTHYLQGRYLCPGDWNDGPLYTNPGLTWVEEGGAEFQAGSTRTEGVSSRKVMLRRLSANREDRVSINKLLASDYELGSKLYTYAYALYRYMYETRPDDLYHLVRTVQSGDSLAYANLVHEWRTDEAMNESYQNFMDKLKAREDSLTDHRASDDYLKAMPKIAPKKLYKTVRHHFGLKRCDMTVKQSDGFRTFELRGERKIGPSQGIGEDSRRASDLADEALKALGAEEWLGYKTLTAYFTDYKVDKGEASFRFVVRGLLEQD